MCFDDIYDFKKPLLNNDLSAYINSDLSTKIILLLYLREC